MNIPREIKSQVVRKFNYSSPVKLFSSAFRDQDRSFTSVLCFPIFIFFLLWSLPIDFHDKDHTHFSLGILLTGITILTLSIINLCVHDHRHKNDNIPSNEVNNPDFGLLTCIAYPFAYLSWLIKRAKFIKTQSDKLVRGKYVDFIPESQKVAWDCVVQQTKLCNLRDQLDANITKTQKSINSLSNMSTSFLSQHPMTQVILDKLNSQKAELDIIRAKTIKEICSITDQLNNMEARVTTISDYKTIVESALLTESNDFIIQEAKAIFEGYHREIQSRQSSILELESDISVLSKSTHEIPQVVLALQ